MGQNDAFSRLNTIAGTGLAGDQHRNPAGTQLVRDASGNIVHAGDTSAQFSYQGARDAAGYETDAAARAGQFGTNAAAQAGQFTLNSIGQAGNFRTQAQRQAAQDQISGADAVAAGKVSSANAWSGALGGIGNAVGQGYARVIRYGPPMGNPTSLPYARSSGAWRLLHRNRLRGDLMADLSIYRMLPQAPQPQPVMTPYQYAAGANAIAEQQQQQELNQQRMAQNAVTLRSTTQEADEYARKTAEHNQIVDVLRKHGGDLEKATPEIMHINPAVGQQFAEQNRARKAAQAEAAKQMFSTLAGYAGDLITAHPYDKDNDPQDTRLGAAYQVRAARLEAAGAIPKGVLPPS